MVKDDGEHVLRGRVLLLMFGFLVVPEFVGDAILPSVDVLQETVFGDVLKAVAAYGYLAAFSLFFKRKVGLIGVDPSFGMIQIQDQDKLDDQDNSIFGS
jgi:hypothetical protein